MRGLRRLVVVGASLAGLRAAEAARAAGFDGELALVGAEPHLPYDRPPLSKDMLRGDVSLAAVSLCTPERAAELALDVHLGVEARGLDLDRRRLLVNGGELRWDGLVLATGSEPRLLEGAGGLAGIHVLRRLEDALALRAALRSAGRLAVVGAGFIGGEVASSARALGVDVTVLEALEAPLVRAIGRRLGGVYARLHLTHGTDLRCGVEVAGFEGKERVEAIRLADGSRVEADVVVLGLGADPAVGWLHGSGLALENGVVCDATLRARPRVYAAGDVARWPNPRFATHMRVEHWTNAAEQGAHAARNLVTGADRPYDAVPYFWSDQYDRRIQFAGYACSDEPAAVLGACGDETPCIGLYAREGRLTAALAVDAPAAFTRLRLLLQRGGDLEAAVDTVRSAGFVTSASAA